MCLKRINLNIHGEKHFITISGEQPISGCYYFIVDNIFFSVGHKCSIKIISKLKLYQNIINTILGIFLHQKS